jgi:hypothetical protein
MSLSTIDDYNESPTWKVIIDRRVHPLSSARLRIFKHFKNNVFVGFLLEEMPDRVHAKSEEVECLIDLILDLEYHVSMEISLLQ